MNEHAKADAIDGSGFVGRMDFRRSHSGHRLWSKELKGRIDERAWRLARACRLAENLLGFGGAQSLHLRVNTLAVGRDSCVTRSARTRVAAAMWGGADAFEEGADGAG